MSQETLIFSVLGLTVRGFHHNYDNWVPKGGQRLSCAFNVRSGAINVLKDDQSVGTVAKEAPYECKDWLKADGNIEAVVIGLQKHHKKKGKEVPVVFVFKSLKNCKIMKMINLKNAITSGIEKMRRKTVKVVNGDASEEMTFSDTEETQFDFSVRGMAMRGFHVYNEHWVPTIGDCIQCSISSEHSVEIKKDGTTIGNVQTEGQKLFREFINAQGVIHAVVEANPKHRKKKGDEIPVVYKFSADDWTMRLKNLRTDIRIDIEKRSKKKKSLRFICEVQNEAGPSCEMQSVDMAGGSGDSLAGPISEMQSVDMAGGSGESLAGPSSEMQSVDMAGGSGESLASTKAGPSSEMQSVDLAGGLGESLTQPSSEIQYVDMAGGSGEIMMESTTTEAKSDNYPEDNIENGAGEKVKISRKRRSNEDLDTEQGAKNLVKKPSSKQVDGSRKGKQCKVPKVDTPAKYSKSTANRKTPRSSTSTPKTPTSGNRITNYFSQTTTPTAAELNKENDIFPNQAKKKILQDEKQEYTQTVEAEYTTTTEKSEENESCIVVQQDMNSTMTPNIPESKQTDVKTNDYTAATSLTRVSCAGYPLKKSQDDTHSEGMLNRYTEQMKSVGILIAPRVMGTVFRVGSKYLMTAFHVVEDLVGMVIDESVVYVTFNESAPDRKVYYIEKVIFFNRDLDVAVIEFADSDGTLPPKMQLSKGDDARHAKDVFLIGYGHPDSNAKHLDPRCKLIFPHSQRFKDAQNWVNKNTEYLKNALRSNGKDPEIVNKGYGDYADDHKIIFDCFMQQGASGSPALACNNNGQVKVVGVLTHGLPEFYFLMPKLTQHRVIEDYRFEAASKMKSVYNSILNENVDLANDLFG